MASAQAEFGISVTLLAVGYAVAPEVVSPSDVPTDIGETQLRVAVGVALAVAYIVLVADNFGIGDITGAALI